jgi:hypothetical protein
MHEWILWFIYLILCMNEFYESLISGCFDCSNQTNLSPFKNLNQGFLLFKNIKIKKKYNNNHIFLVLVYEILSSDFLSVLFNNIIIIFLV